MSADHTRARPRQRPVDPSVAAVAQALQAISTRLNEDAVRRFQGLSGIMLRGARPVPVGTGGTTRPSAASCSLIGWGLHNSGLTTVQVNLRDGRDATGDMVVPITLNPGESTRDNYGPGGLSIQTGLYVEVLGGTVEGCVFLRGPE